MEFCRCSRRLLDGNCLAHALHTLPSCSRLHRLMRPCTLNACTNHAERLRKDLSQAKQRYACSRCCSSSSGTGTAKSRRVCRKRRWYFSTLVWILLCRRACAAALLSSPCHLGYCCCTSRCHASISCFGSGMLVKPRIWLYSHTKSCRTCDSHVASNASVAQRVGQSMRKAAPYHRSRSSVMVSSGVFSSTMVRISSSV